jgi:hypothetical protein
LQCTLFLDYLIRPKARLARSTINHWIAERLFVAARLPNGAVHQDRTIHAYDVVALVYDHTPPIIFQVAL